MANNTRSKIQREADRVEIAKRYLHGETQREIAADLNISQQMVSYDLKIIQGQWRAMAIDDIGKLRGRELARIDMMEVEYWKSWEKSKDETMRARRNVKDGDIVSSSIERTTTSGNPAFLQGIQWCVSQRCKILGLYQLTNRVVGISEIRNEDGTRQVEAFDLSVLDVDELRAYLAIVQAMKSRAGNNSMDVIDGKIVE